MTEPVRPGPDEYNPFYETYVSKVGPEPLLAQLEANGRETVELLEGVDPALAPHAYAPGKWTLAQVAGHMGDTERLFAYRLLQAARGGAGALPRMDPQVWAATRDVSGRSLRELAAEFAAIRSSTLFLLRGLGPDDWGRTVNASGSDASVRALAYMVAGHELHHRAIIRERYLA